MVNVFIKIAIELNLVELNQIEFNWYKLVEFKPNWIQIGFNLIILIILLSWIQPNYKNSIMRRDMLIFLFISCSWVGDMSEIIK
jgi:hypothetical protein